MPYDFERLSFPVLVCDRNALIRYHNQAASPYRCFRRGLSLTARLPENRQETLFTLPLRRDIPFRTAYIVRPGGETEETFVMPKARQTPFGEEDSIWFFFPALQIGSELFADSGLGYCLLRVGQGTLAFCREDADRSAGQTERSVRTLAANLRDSLSRLLPAELPPPDYAPAFSCDFDDGVGILRRFIRLAEPDIPLSLRIEDFLEPEAYQWNTTLLIPDFDIAAALYPALLSLLSELSDSRCAVLSFQLDGTLLTLSLATDCLSENEEARSTCFRAIHHLKTLLPEDRNASAFSLDAAFDTSDLDAPGYRRLTLSLSVRLLPGRPISLGVRVFHPLPIGAAKLILAMLLFFETREEKIHNGVTQRSQFQGTIEKIQ